MSDITWHYSLSRKGFRLHVLGTAGSSEGPSPLRHTGNFLEAPCPYKTVEAFKRDYAADVARAQDEIRKALA